MQRRDAGDLAIRYWSLRHSISIAEADGTAMGGTWTKDGERRQAGPMVEFTQSIYLNIAALPEQIIPVASTAIH